MKRKFRATKNPFKRTEEQEQTELCKWIKLKYPNILYTVDLGGIRLQPHQRGLMKTRARRGHPDLILQEWFLDKYCGLAIEFKKTGEKVCKLNGELKKNDHLEEQLEYILALRERYYIAGFVCGLDAAKIVISAYLEANSTSLQTIDKHIYPPLTKK